MPTYVYACPNCGKVVEIVKAYDDSADTPICQDCQVETKRVWQAPLIRYVGKGFYSTDNLN